MRIYNTLSGQKEEFSVPDAKVGMYVCGPTVYDMPHLGHARVEVIFDVVRRWLEYRKLSVNYIHNITDVDDKIIKKAKDSGKTEKDIANKYEKAFFSACKKLAVKKATKYPKATEHIPEMIELVQHLIKNGHAYIIEGSGVYYDISKFAEYGKLSHQPLEQLQSGTRVEIEEKKRSPLDFALWKVSKEQDELAWDSPWGRGRPGWHIECSVMSAKYVGRLDIHGGGLDLIFPHHENEIAQSEGAYGKQFSRFWMHNGFITINKEKMSKSLGNFFTVKDILKTYEPEAVRLFLLSTHYRGPIDFTHEQLDLYTKSLDGLRHTLELAEAALAKNRAEGQPIKKLVKHLAKNFEDAMDDDFTTTNALASLYELSSLINNSLDQTSAKELRYALAKYKKLAGVLGLKLKPKKAKAGKIQMDDSSRKSFSELAGGEKSGELSIAKELTDELITYLVELRSEFRKKGDYKKSDELRAKLSAMGIVIEDTADGVKWKRA